VITLSTYTEQQPVTAVTEPPKARQPEEKTEHGDFAKILAGLMRETENETAGNADVALANVSDEYSADEAPKTNNIFNAAQKTTEEENDPSDVDFLEEYQVNVMLGAQRLLDNVEPEAEGDFVEGFLSDAELKVNLLTDVEQNADLSELTEAITDTAETVSFAAFTDDLPIQNDNQETDKKESSLSLSKNIEGLSPAGSREELSSLQKGQEKESSRFDNSRTRSKKDRVTLDIRDHRTGADGVKNTEVSSSRRVQADSPTREITLELRLPAEKGGNASDSPQTKWEVKAGNALENMLARELHQNFNGDIVRHASMALRDGGEGTIKLALKPETLGNVKIHLELSENKITGHIVVESEEALNAFKKEISSLEQAFRDSGFTNADLNLSLTTDGGNAENWEQEADAHRMRNIASLYDDYSDSADQGLVSVVDVYYGRKHGSVNMLA